MTLSITITGDKQWDLLGDEYLRATDVPFVFDNICREQWVRLRIDPTNLEDNNTVYFFERSDLVQLLKMLVPDE